MNFPQTTYKLHYSPNSFCITDIKPKIKCFSKKNLKVGLFEGKKIEKSCTVPKKIERGYPSVSSAFANARKLLAKAMTRTRDRCCHRKPSKVCTKKWYIHEKKVA